jgi:hypothetical protein
VQQIGPPDVRQVAGILDHFTPPISVMGAG